MKTENRSTKTTYDPFLRGPFTVGVRTFEALDPERNRRFPCEIWYPAAAEYSGQDLDPATQDLFTVAVGGGQRRQPAVRDAAARPGSYPLILYSHASMQHRRAATFLGTHLCSHGYVVAGLDHSEVVAPELARKAGETEEQKQARWDALISSRVPDIRFLLDQLLNHVEWAAGVKLDTDQIGISGHSLGAWTVLTAPETEPRLRAVVAHAAGGTSTPKPGILPLTLTFAWGRDVPTLYLAAENDVALPVAGKIETLARTPGTKQLVVLRRADHLHFMDQVEAMHEMARTMPVPPELVWTKEEIRPITELCTGEQAQLFVRGLTLCHMDAFLRQREEARQFLAGDIAAELASRGVEAIVHRA